MVEFAGGYVTQLADKMMASFCGRLFINLTVSTHKLPRLEKFCIFGNFCEEFIFASQMRSCVKMKPS